MKERCNQFIDSTDMMYYPTSTSSDMSDFPQLPALAHCEIQSQPYSTPMEPENSLICGTTFSDLIMPYYSGWHLYRMKEEVSS